MNSLGSIDLNSRVPYYLQVKELIQKQIEDHILIPGDRLPSEAELCEQLQISRTVVRQALLELDHEGLIYKRKGRGAYVAEPKVGIALTRLTAAPSTLDKPSELRIRSTILDQGLIPASIQVARNLDGLKPGDPVLHIERVRFFNDEPMILIDTFLHFPGFEALLHEDVSRSIANIMRTKFKLPYDHGEKYIEAVPCNERESKVFGVALGTPMLMNSSRIYTQDNTQIAYSVAIHRGDRSRIEAKVLFYSAAKEYIGSDGSGPKDTFIWTD